MHLLLTDRLACPRCGPGFGLILLSRVTEERRVLEGSLGCPNCRERYPVTAGYADLRPPPREPLLVPDGEPPEHPEIPPRTVEALAAALGLGEGAGTTLLFGAAVRFAPALSRRLPEVEVAVADATTASWQETPGLSRLACGSRLPFFDRVLRGAAVGGADTEPTLMTEILRVVAPRHRVVVLDPDPAARERLEAAGAREIVEGPGLLVGAP